MAKLINELMKGTWNSSTAYTVGDIVTLSGSSYICIANTTNNTPPNATYWALLAQAGEVGLTEIATLTNKTMNADDNTFSNFKHGVEVDNPSFGVHGVTGDVVGTTDTQVITHKDLTDSSNSFPSLPSGLIFPYGGTTAPTGYLLCDGTSYLRTTYAALFTAIGVAFGTADGTHFNVPDLRGRFLRGKDGATARDPDAAGRTAIKTGGNTGDNVGSLEDDSFQGHLHSLYDSENGSGKLGVTLNTNTGNSSLRTIESNSSVGGTAYAEDTGISGAVTPKAGIETRPKNVNVNYIIKI